MRKSWYVERRNVVDKVFKTLTGGTGPRLVGLVGASGSGKTTTASEIVRTAQVREAFSDGIVWLSANDGARGRLHALTLQLARMVFEDIMGSVGRRPSESEDPAAYVKTCMKMAHGGKGKGMKCLVVADNVCEEEVISKLVETGMWILLTTRDGELVKGGHGEAVEVDKLSAADAESVLRRAAELPPRARLPDDAIDIIEMCNGVAMDLAFVGRWSTVRGRQDRAAWSDAANKIREEIRKFEADSRAESSRSIHRKAILQAGFEDLAVGSDDVRVQRLYLSLAVLPDGHAFTLKDAAVLLYDRTPGAEDEASVGQVVGILERWNIIRSIQGIYRMHDAHSIFARENLMDSGDVRLPALFRWAKYISSLEFLRSVDGYVLKGLWLAVERVGGKGWADTRPYKAALIEMDDSDPLLRQSIEAVMLFEEVEEDWEAATATGRRLLDAEKRELGADHPYILNSYQRLAVWAERLGNVKEAAEWRENEREALPLVLARMRPQSDSGTKDGADDAGGLVSLAATMLDLTPEENDGAEKLLRRALEIQEADLGQAEVEMASTLYELALRACRARAVRDRQAGRLKEAEELLRDCLKIEESKQRGDRKDARLASTLHELGVCVRQAEKLEEAEDILRRCLGIKEEQFGPENVQVASTLRELVICVQKAGQRGEARRLEETEQLLRRCLDTKKEKLASTLEQLGVCVRGAGRLAEAEDLLRRCLAIKETLGLEHVQVASTLHLLGSCVSEAGKLEEGEELLMRCLAIKEMTLGPEHLQVASTLHALGSCVSEAGRWEEGERLLRRCLAIQAAKLGTEDARMASTLHELGVCASQAGRLDEAEQLLRRSLRIQEAKLGAGDEQVGSTLNELSICVRQAGRLEEAEELTGRWRENEEERIGKEEV